LLDRETQDVRAAEAVALFCYQVKKWIGAFAAALGGLDTLVFAGGIGENAPTVRARICDGLGFLGIGLEEKRNAAHEGVISAAARRVSVRVIRTDEELMIARSVCRALGFGMPAVERNSDHATKFISRPNAFSALGPPIAKPPPGATGTGVLTPVQIAVSPISQTRSQPGDNSEKSETQGTKGVLLC
jgi:hypothetical protein